MEMLNRAYDPPTELPAGARCVVNTRGTTEESVLETLRVLGRTRG
jgi:hypothetical protein